MRATKGLQPTLDVASAIASVDLINPVRTINGLAGTTLCRYNAQHVSASGWRPWGYGRLIPKASTGTAPGYAEGSLFHGPHDNFVKFNEGEVFQYTADPTFMDVATEDLVVHCLLYMPPITPVAVQYIISKVGATGWYLWTTTDNVIRFGYVGAVSQNVKYNTALTPGGVYLVSGYRDGSETNRENGFQLYLNNLNDTGYANAYTPADVGTLTTTANFTIGASNGLTYKFGGGFAWLLVATRPNWFAGGATNLTHWFDDHRDCYHRLLALKSKSVSVPTSFTRTSAAVVEKRLLSDSREFYQVGNRLPRNTNVAKTFHGIRLEESGNQYCTNSADINSWPTKANCTTPSSIEGPIRGKPAYAIVESTDGGPTAHYLLSTTTSATDVVGKVLEVYVILAANGTSDRRFWIRVQEYDGSSLVDTNTATLDTEITAATLDSGFTSYGIRSLGTWGGKVFKLVWFRGVAIGADGTRRIVIQSKDAAGSSSYTGTGINCGYVQLAQLEYFASTLSPYLWLKFDELSGSAIADSSGNGRNQTLVGSDANFWKAGKYGNAGYFDALIPNRIELPAAYFDGTKGTWACWCKLDWTSEPNTGARLFTTNHSSGANYNSRAFWYTAGPGFRFTVGNGITTNSDCNLGDMRVYDNQWIHIAFTWSYPGSGNTTITGYLNGAFIISTTIAGPLINPDTNCMIGRYVSAGNDSTFYMDDFVLYQKCLRDADIALLAAQRPKTHRGPFTSAIISAGSLTTRSADSAILYAYSNAKAEGSKVCKFFKEMLTGCERTIWEISDGGSANERIYCTVNESGYVSVTVVVGGVIQGTVMIDQNVCNETAWTIGARWTASLLSLVLYNHKTALTYTASTAIAAFPSGLDENRPVMPCGAVIGECRDLNYYESDNRRLIFGQ